MWYNGIYRKIKRFWQLINGQLLNKQNAICIGGGFWHRQLLIECLFLDITYHFVIKKNFSVEILLSFIGIYVIENFHYFFRFN